MVVVIPTTFILLTAFIIFLLHYIRQREKEFKAAHEKSIELANEQWDLLNDVMQTSIKQYEELKELKSETEEVVKGSK